MKKQETRDKKQKGIILDRDAKVLRQVAKPVGLTDIGSKELGDTIAKMKKALAAEEDGVAIAAPQIGASLRIFVVSKRALELTRKKKAVSDSKELEDLVFINPEVVKVSKRKKKMEEGCLSVRWLYGEVERSEKITIAAYNEHGTRHTFGASGLLAQIFQHEIDHLDGILFIDKAKNVQDLPPSRVSEPHFDEAKTHHNNGQ
jgi:peptide deformylase